MSQKEAALVPKVIQTSQYNTRKQYKSMCNNIIKHFDEAMLGRVSQLIQKSPLLLLLLNYKNSNFGSQFPMSFSPFVAMELTVKIEADCYISVSD